jgi:hypothetical protein
MWQLTIYELIPWEPLKEAVAYGQFQNLLDCHMMNNIFNAAISEETNLAGTYISMCVRML